MQSSKCRKDSPSRLFVFWPVTYELAQVDLWNGMFLCEIRCNLWSCNIHNVSLLTVLSKNERCPSARDFYVWTWWLKPCAAWSWAPPKRHRDASPNSTGCHPRGIPIFLLCLPNYIHFSVSLADIFHFLIFVINCVNPRSRSTSSTWFGFVVWFINVKVHFHSFVHLMSHSVGFAQKKQSSWLHSMETQADTRPVKKPFFNRYDNRIAHMITKTAQA